MGITTATKQKYYKQTNKNTHIMSATTKLPTPSGSVGTWGAELNDFLTQSMVGTTTGDVNNGLLKADHAAITTGGKVGIGTSAPTTLAQVKDGDLTIIGTGKVGIGTNIPLVPLQVLDSTQTTGQSIIGVFGDITIDGTYLGISTSQKSGGHSLIQSIKKSGTELGDLILNRDGGKVGIGTDAPQSILDLKLSGAEPKFIKFDSIPANIPFKKVSALQYTYYGETANIGMVRGGTTDISSISIDFNEIEVVRFQKDGKVGIGTDTPTSKLHVVGIPVYVDNAAAIAGGLTAGAFYRTSTGALFVTL